MQFLKIVFFLLLTFPLISQASLNSKIKQFITEEKALSESHIGISVFDIEKNQEIISYNSTKLFIPASVLKIFYTLSAIETYGTQFKFRTKIFYTGEVLYDGSLQGDILIYASNDPTFGSPRFYKEGIKTIIERIKLELEKKHIYCIEGDIKLILPNKCYPINGSWTVEDIANYYGGGAWAMNINDNEYTIDVRLANKLGESTIINSIHPHIPFLKILNNIKMAKKGSGDNSYIYGMPFDFNREIKGTLPLGSNTYKIKGAIPNPPLTFLNMLTSYLENDNYYFQDYYLSNINPKHKTHLFDIISPTLIDIVKKCNDYSINMYSESLSQLLCLKKNHPDKYLTHYEISDFFSKYGEEFSDLQIIDGSGLSSSNFLSPNKINKFIYLQIKKLGLNLVLEILPKVGRDGFAKNLIISDQDVWIKSGSINGVLNYTGIFKTNNNKHYAFTIMSNNSIKRNKKSIKNSLLKLLLKIITLSSK